MRVSRRSTPLSRYSTRCAGALITVNPLTATATYAGVYQLVAGNPR